VTVPAVEIVRETLSAAKGRYVAHVTGKPDAEMTYSVVNDKLLIIDHTEVPDALRGLGVGAALVTRAVEDARAAGVKIIPLCPFAKAQFERHPDWADVLKG
jgi:uncharacterized protein